MTRALTRVARVARITRVSQARTHQATAQAQTPALVIPVVMAPKIGSQVGIMHHLGGILILGNLNMSHTWPAPMQDVPVTIIPAGNSADSAASTALAAAESAHNSEQAASAYAASAQTSANEAADSLCETSTFLGEIQVAVKQFGKCNACRKWYFVHKDLCIFPGCSRNPMTNQVDSLVQQQRTLHDQVTAQEALINTLLHSSGTSSSSTASPDVIQSQAQQISVLTGIIAQMVQYSVPSTYTVWQGQHLPTIMPARPKVPSSVHHTAAMDRMPAHSGTIPTSAATMDRMPAHAGIIPPSIMAVKAKAMPAMPLHNITNTIPTHHAPSALPVHLPVQSPVQLPGQVPPTAEVPPAADGGSEPHAEHAVIIGDDDDEEEDDCDDDDDVEPGAAGEGGSGSKPTKKKKKTVGKKGGPKKRKHSTDI